jgi:hypothetical protein
MKEEEEERNNHTGALLLRAEEQVSGALGWHIHPTDIRYDTHIGSQSAGQRVRKGVCL